LTTGIRTVNSIWQDVYYIVVFLIVAGFAVYDAFKRRAPDKALVLFCTMALVSPALAAWDHNSGAVGWSNLISPFLTALSGAATGFIVLLAAAMASKGGNGVGGGDIKLAAVLGFIYGPFNIIYILLIATLLAIPAGLIRRKQSGGKILRLPFVPFIAIGSLAAVIARFI